MGIRSALRTLFTLGRGVATPLPDAAGQHDPIDLFAEWFAAARRSGIMLHEAAALATATPDGKPSVRMVLLKSCGRDGFVFYTNYESRKARELEANPRAALVLHWAVLLRQVILEGTVERVSEEESRRYFGTRPRGSQIGAWASLQSRPLESREVLDARVREIEARFQDAAPTLPPFWGGYRLRPERIEFWQGRPDRLHDRLSFRRDGDGWKPLRLYP